MPAVSIIVPVYKSEEYLSRCIDSILPQTFTDFELILVDDGSPDNCGVICDEYAMRDNRVRVVHKENGGVSSARNAGLDIAVGTYIAFVDSDDTVSDKYIEELMQWREYDYVTAGYTWQDHLSNWHVRTFEESDTTIDVIRTMPSKYLGKYYFGSPWATLMKRALIEDNSLRFDTAVHSGEDTLFIISYLNYVSSVKITPLCGYYYHYYPTSLVNSTHKELWKWRVAVERAFLDFFGRARGKEHIFLLNREFELLMNLISYYELSGFDVELRDIYEDTLFRTCIMHKMTNGSIRERLFIYAMNKNNYPLYKKVNKYMSAMVRVKAILMRLLK